MVANGIKDLDVVFGEKSLAENKNAQ